MRELTAAQAENLAEAPPKGAALCLMADLTALAVTANGETLLVQEESVGAARWEKLLTALLCGDAAPVLHHAKPVMRALMERNMAPALPGFDTALAAYDLNPSQSDYPVSKLATNFLGVSVDDSDAAACAEAIWNLWEPLMEELEKAGVTGYVGKVNMDRNNAPGVLEESTEESTPAEGENAAN